MSDLERVASGLNARTLPPVRLEWRPDLTARWQLVSSGEDAADTEELIQGFLKDFRPTGGPFGQLRVVEQRVVAVRGIGQDWSEDDEEDAVDDDERSLEIEAAELREENRILAERSAQLSREVAYVREQLTRGLRLPPGRQVTTKELAKVAADKLLASEDPVRRVRRLLRRRP